MNKLITTKFCKPNLGQFTIRRTRILEQLNRRADVPIIMFCAPAGFGKSTMLAQWIELLDRPYCWLSLDVKDCEPRRFITYLVAALFANFPPPKSYLRMKEKFELNGNVNEYLEGVISLIDQPMTLVLDDIHLLADSESVDLLNLLITRLPCHLQLVMAGRHSRFIDLSPARLNFNCVEINEQQLKFDYHELILMVNRKVTPWFNQQNQEITKLYQATEGWPAGVQLALLAQQNNHNFSQEQSIGINHQTIDYLTAQAIVQLDDSLKNFLLATSFLDRFTPELANLIAQTDHASVLINQLETKNLFIINLDATSQWYRYHHLFRQVLQSLALANGLDDKLIYKKAFQWCVDQKLDEEAISYALLGGYIDQAVALVDKLVDECIKRGLFLKVEQWICQIPTDKLIDYPRLILYFAWALSHLGRIAQAKKMLEPINALVMDSQAPTSDEFLHHFYAVQMVIAVGADDLEKIELLVEKRPVFDGQHGFSTGVVHNTFAIALSVLNKPQQALDEVKLALKAHQECDSSVGIVFALGIRAMINIQCGDLASADYDAKQGYQFLQYRKVNSNSLLYAVFGVIEGVILYLQGELEQAIFLLSESIPYMDDCVYNDLRNICYITLSKIFAEQGQFENSLSVLNKSLLSNYECIKQRTQAKVVFEKTRLLIENNQLEQAHLLTQQQVITFDLEHLPQQWDDVTGYHELSYCLCKTYYGDDAEVATRLAHLLPLAQQSSRLLLQLDILLIQALYFSINQQTPTCEKIIAEAISLAKLQKIYAPFHQKIVINDRQIYSIINKLDDEFFSRLHRTSPFSKPSPIPQPPSPSLGKPSKNNNLLNSRELSILALIATGESNKSIANTLSLSVNTIRWHVSNILSKLVVSNRTEAVACARKQGLLN